MPKELGRILLITSTFPRWENDVMPGFVFNLAQDLQELGWRIDVLAPHAPQAAICEILGDVRVRRFRYLWPESAQTVCYEGSSLVSLRTNRWNGVKVPSLVLFELLAILRSLAREKYDILHSHWILPQGFTGALAAIPFQVPHVLTVHGGDVFALRGSILRPFKRFAIRYADAVTVNSTATETAVRAIAPAIRNLRRIPMGVSGFDLPATSRVQKLREKYRQGSGPLLLFLGRVVEEKGVGDVIRALTLLLPHFPDATAVIAGDGQDRARMETLARDLGVPDRVMFVGWVAAEEAPDYLSAADVFIGPSKPAPDGWVEAQGLTYAEAMLARTPVIATPVGGIIDLVRHEETGLLVSVSAPQEIAAAIQRLIEEPNLADRLSKAGHALVQEKFTRRVSAEAFSELFDSLLAESGRFRRTSSSPQ